MLIMGIAAFAVVVLKGGWIAAGVIVVVGSFITTMSIEGSLRVFWKPSEVDVPTTEEDLRKLMRDPRYWCDLDPVFVDKVQQGFKILFP